MTRDPRLVLAALPLAALGLGACQREREPQLPPEVSATAAALPAAPVPVASAAADKDGKGAQPTPLGERVATLGLLNKRNNLTREIKLKPGGSERIDNVIVKLAACERTAPWEDPPEVGAFVQLFVEERETIRQRLAWRKVFSGWLFRNSPSLNPVEHPVYDVWVKDCAMNFPGEDDKPAAAASAKSAAKPDGRSPRPNPSRATSPAAPLPRPAAA